MTWVWAVVGLELWCLGAFGFPYFCTVPMYNALGIVVCCGIALACLERAERIA